MSSGYALHPAAFADLDEILDYIAQKNPDAAERVIAEIFDTIRALVSLPNQGHRRPDLTSRPLRFTLLREYLIVYAPEETPESPRDGRDLEGQGVKGEELNSEWEATLRNDPKGRAKFIDDLSKCYFRLRSRGVLTAISAFVHPPSRSRTTSAPGNRRLISPASSNRISRR